MTTTAPAPGPCADVLRRAQQLCGDDAAQGGIFVPPPPPPPGPGGTATAPAATTSSFAGRWTGSGSVGCGFGSFVIDQQGSGLVLQDLPGNGPIAATTSGHSAQAQSAVMFGKPNHLIVLVLRGNELDFRAESDAGSCGDAFRRQ